MCSGVTLDAPRRLISVIRIARMPAPRGTVNQSDMVSPLEFEHPFAAERPANAVGEGAEVCARQVVLIVARVEMVGDVEYLQADGRVVMKQRKPLAHLEIERRKRRATAGSAWSPAERTVLVP